MDQYFGSFFEKHDVLGVLHTRNTKFNLKRAEKNSYEFSMR